MVVKSDGSKWACSSCLKGHRVSGCNHTDRELTLVPKKGRPVTQCHHCRLERKKRSSHVKCDCGESEKMHHSKEKCIHLREAEERAKAGLNDESPLEKDPAHLSAIADEQGCCCHHGGKCSCSLTKKDSAIDITHDGTPHGPAVHKPRLESTKSDGSITVFANGHHKPVHRKNNAAHECGMPYKMPLPRASTDQGVPIVARRSVDSLTMDSAMSTALAGFSAQGRAPPMTERNVSKSEQQSPRLYPTGLCNGGLAHDKFSSIDFGQLEPIQTNQTMESVESLAFPAFDPMTGIDSYDPWSTFPSSESLNLPNNNPFGAWATNFDNGPSAQPALTAASSGTRSDIDEIPPMDDFYNFAMPSIAEDAGFDANMSDGANTNRRSLPPNFFGNVDFTLSGGNDWQSAESAMSAIDVSKGTDSSPNANELWQTPGTPSNSNRRGPMPTGRPPSHSVGPGSAPNDDVIKQLFPDIDVASPFGNAGSPTMNSFAFKRFNSLPTGDGAPVNMDGRSDENDGFTSQPWTDGSISVTNKSFTHPFVLDQDYMTPDFSGNWEQ